AVLRPHTLRAGGEHEDSMHCLCRCSRKEECASWPIAHAKPHGWLADGRRRLSRELSLAEEISHSHNSFCDPRTRTRIMTAGIHRKYVAVQVRSVWRPGTSLLNSPDLRFVSARRDPGVDGREWGGRRGSSETKLRYDQIKGCFGHGSARTASGR